MPHGRWFQNGKGDASNSTTFHPQATIVCFDTRFGW